MPDKLVTAQRGKTELATRREGRLAEALRANLQKRKAQQRLRRTAGDETALPEGARSGQDEDSAG